MSLTSVVVSIVTLGLAGNFWFKKSKDLPVSGFVVKWLIGLSFMGLVMGAVLKDWLFVAISAVCFLEYFFADKIWQVLHKREATLLMLNITVETWYWERPASKWWRRKDLALSLWHWANGRGIDVVSFDLPTLRKYQKYHWIYFEGDEAPFPEGRQNATFIALMENSHKVGPYSKLDK